MLEIKTPGADQLEAQRLQENPYLMTRFGFQKPVPENDVQKELMEHMTSGLLWEDGTKFAMGLIADRNGNMLRNEEIIGGIIDPSDEFWQEEQENGLTLVQNMIWHQSYHQSAVVFGRKDEWEEDDKRGAGYFRLALDTSQASGQHRWATAEFMMPNVMGEDHRHVQESIQRMLDEGWEVWRIDETYRGQYGNPPRRRMVLFIVSPEPRDNKHFTYKLEKCCMKQLRNRLIHRNNRSPIQPSRREEMNMMPLPCMAHGLVDASVEVRKQ